MNGCPSRCVRPTVYTVSYIICSPVEKLYTFLVSDQVLEELGECAEMDAGPFY